MQTDIQVCAYCSRQLQPEVTYCPHCGAGQAAAQAANAPPHTHYSEPFQPPTGPGKAFQPAASIGQTAIQPLPGQQALALQPGVVPLWLKTRFSGFAVTSLVVGIVGIILALFDLIIDVWDAASTHFEGPQSSTTLGVLLIFAIICWVPALITFIFGLLAKARIGHDGGQTMGLGFAVAGIILGAVGFVLPLLGIGLYLLTLIP
ncbi:MAG TPA: DUF4190 domain-containing protein [Ktedonobacterales bacterium]|nr:DUF4190 domain-containing protein [Ktedonobacterales bacterium]